MKKVSCIYCSPQNVNKKIRILKKPGFQKNYLSVGQSLDGAGGVANLEPIEYPFAESFPTNTGQEQF